VNKMEEFLAQLDSLSAAFIEELKSVLPDFERFLVIADHVGLIIPARHRQTGDMHIWLHDDQITVAIGLSFHWRFFTHDFASDDPTWQPHENEREAAREAVKFIRDVLADKVVLYVSSHTAGSYDRGSTSQPPMEPGMREYVWSGPFMREG